MQKLLLTLIIFNLITTLGFPGGGKEQTTSSENQKAKKHWNLKTTVVDPENTPVWRTLIFFKESIEKQHNNITIDLYPNGVLSNRSNPTLIQQLQSGVVELAPVTSLSYTNIEPKFSLISLPFLFESLENAIKFYKSDIADELISNLDSKGIKGIALWPRGFRQISNSRRPIKTPEDVRGLKMRIPDIKLFMSVFQAMGATTVPLASGEIYSALQMKTVDGQDNGITVVDSWKFYEVQKYYTLVNYSTDAYVLGMSMIMWQQLPEAVQKTIIQTARDCIDFTAKEEEKAMTVSLEKLKKHMEIYSPTANERAQFIRAMEPIYNEYKDIIGTGLTDRTFTFLGIKK